MKPFAVWAAAFAFAAAGPVLAAGAAPELPGPAVGAQAPDFSLTTLDGKRVRLADYRGKTLVLNVWGSWCPPCRLETPDFVAEAKAGAVHGVAYLGIDTTESVPAVRAYVAAKGIPYPQVVTTATSDFARAYDIRNYPTTFVIDPAGVLRARHADNLLPRDQLRAYVAAAQRNASAPLTSAFQSQLDALLDPAHYPFTGDPATVRSNVVLADRAIASSNDLLDEAMEDPTRDHDLLRTQQEAETLRAGAIAALAPIAQSDADRVLLARLRGDEAAALGKWGEADVAYQAALQIAPKDIASLGGQAYAVSHLGDDARLAAIDAQVADLAPSPAAYVALARVLAKTGNLKAAEEAFEHARTLAAGDPPAIARTNLYYGRSESEARHPAKARAAFDRALAAAVQISSTDPRAQWYIEQAQEGAVALGVVPGAPPSLSLAPWTGPELPGSIAGTVKYRLVVTGAAGSKLVLASAGLPKRWIGSFCTDRVCAPFRTSVVIPADGVKIVEFQVIPTGTKAAAPKVRIVATLANHTVASTTADIHV
ncbi:MAG: cytochrome biosis protein [Candidatus Eremiobacteraeota bacterium]|nr:cytochrome biosis protein [Candidatus Eremiobacteraeota bacterium]